MPAVTEEMQSFVGGEKINKKEKENIKNSQIDLDLQACSPLTKHLLVLNAPGSRNTRKPKTESSLQVLFPS